ncbi:14583_t:CDS:2 [Gigaspora rosea]|nr:14583_t:CDS:2 [Gigaspora rosea]
MLNKSKKIEKNQATHREAIQAALQALEKSKSPNQHIQVLDQVHVQANPQPTQFLRSEIEALRIENKMLKEENVLLKEELETFKNPGTSPLKLALKYPTSQRKDQEANGQAKKRKTLPFARLLTSDQSWQEIREAEELVNKKAEDVKRRKEKAALKHANRQI